MQRSWRMKRKDETYRKMDEKKLGDVCYICNFISYDLSKPIEAEIHSKDENEIRKFNEVMEEFK